MAALHPASKNVNQISKISVIRKRNKCYRLKTFSDDQRYQKKFQNLNPFISVKVFVFNGKTCIYHVYVTSDQNRQYHVNLLLGSYNVNFFMFW